MRRLPLPMRNKFFKLQYWLINRLGLRNHLHCPKCRAVGTYKPYLLIHVNGVLTHRARWLCKYCGYFKLAATGEEKQCVIADKGFWEYADEANPEVTHWTPSTAVKGMGSANPWTG